MSRWTILTCGIALLLPAMEMPLRAAASPGGETLAIGGAFGSSRIRRYLPGSRSTVLYPATLGSDGRRSPSDHKSGLSSGTWDKILSSWKEDASLLLATLNPEMIRDGDGVIQAAVLRSTDPLVATCMLLPGFLDRFSAVFGPEILVAVPSENTLYVFPKLANRMPGFRERIVDEFLLSPRPVSTEFFEVSRKGLRGAGDFRPEE
jgi:hypothetical protein